MFVLFNHRKCFKSFFQSPYLFCEMKSWYNSNNGKIFQLFFFLLFFFQNYNKNRFNEWARKCSQIQSKYHAPSSFAMRFKFIRKRKPKHAFKIISASFLFFRVSFSSYLLFYFIFLFAFIFIVRLIDLEVTNWLCIMMNNNENYFIDLFYKILIWPLIWYMKLIFRLIVIVEH